MDRKVMIISNPGEKDDENYCEGAINDAANYLEYLRSPYGGAWKYPSEFVMFNERPSVTQLRRELNSFCSLDYSLIIFTGHGEYSTDANSTILELKAGEEINSLELYCGTKKRTLILDCCRKIPKKLLIEEKFLRIAVSSVPEFDADVCRQYYNKDVLENCDPAIIIAFSCSIDEFSYDDRSKKGGVYSLNLIRSATNWVRNYDLTSFVDNEKYATLSIVKAHNNIIDVVKERTGDRQHPSIVKPRSGTYFPFGIVVKEA
jgi:hypothetical protein